MSNKPEVWLRGPLPDMPPLVQPVAHALLQACEEVQELMAGFPAEKLWQKVAGMASPGFHLQHLTGVLDRLFTYARAEALDEAQQQALQAEGKPTGNPDEVNNLVEKFSRQVDIALNQLRQVKESELTDVRGVGRAQVPSTMLGLYTHSAEHTMRHLGQLLVTVRILVAEF
ncbi:DinB family protein [Mucilaginibacter lacusdianchii]|uniref:DinB family protein n=1 Tax=Mucilaginibacter lacusdianchii TaxID=2684211 RepID=UPI00131CF73B|nr:DinB family protein [Mucilaginibacter sp. JXJ CY 39]